MISSGVLRHDDAPSKQADVATEKPPEVKAEPSYDAIDKTLDVERWKKAINPDYAARMAACTIKTDTGDGLGLHWLTTIEGAGEGASCAESIAITLTIWDARGNRAYHGISEITLGEQSIATGLDAALVGIRAGETRTVIVPPALLAHAKTSTAPKALLRALPAGKVVVMDVTRTAAAK
jgi:hypothetical protein